MNIYAKSKRDLNTITALVHLHIFGKNEPKKRMIMYFVINFMCGVVILCESILLDLYVLIKCYIILVFFVALMFLRMYFILPKKKYKSMCKMADMEDECRFTDNKFIIKSIGANSDYFSLSEIEYTFFHKVYETSEYFFLYITRMSVFVADKSSMSMQDISDIRSKLGDILGKKYIICNY